jgi:hypothetical protein
MSYFEQIKMAKSTTKNKLVEFDIEKIRRFTQTELTNLSQTQNDLPFCYQIGNDILVGNNKIVKVNDSCWRVIEQGQQIFDFFNRKDAIFYCIAVHKQQLQLANDIRTNDSLLNKLEFEATLYRLRYKKAQEKGDDWGEEYYSNKYTEVMARMDHIKKELKKSLNLAKYIKL